MNHISQMFKSNLIEHMTKVEDEAEDEDFDDLPVKGIRPIVETYHRCDLVVLQPAIFKKVAQENNIGACCKMVKKECSKLANHAVASSRVKCELTKMQVLNSAKV
ncbi:hypothetical protein J1N35_043405 [Gossypium stocksii]|uniref:Uncharacterized protein n=1 Tax=Gossypium stocksii TaxID=47602 RepID=A0A9D3U7D9_9ROSI|nr:hypothetical protein J1N35_043405 [Gossypium stocksii]